MSLKQETFSAVRWTSLAMIGKTTLQFLQLAILSRLLLPEDFGLMALVISIIAFSQVFIDMGVSNALIHHQVISEQELSSLYWLSIFAGSVLTICLILMSSLIANFYNEPSLKPLLIFISFYFLITALSQQLRVLAEKELRFEILAKIELASTLIGTVIAVTWALLFPSVMALVVGIMMSAITMTSLCWLFLANGWRPLLYFNLNCLNRFLWFSSYVLANNLINSLNQQADILISGRTISGSALGLYSMPRDLTLRVAGLINPIVTRISLPVMAKRQNDKRFLKTVYLKMLHMTASINFPIYLGISAFAPEIVMILFGSQWTETIPLLRILAIWGMLRSISNPVGSLIFAVGRADLVFRWNLGVFLIIFPSILLGSQYGNIGIAIIQLCLIFFLFIPVWYFLVHPLCGAGLKEYVLNLTHPLWISLFSIIFAFSVVLPFSDIWIRLIIGFISGTVSYLMLSIWWNIELVNGIKELIMMKHVE